MAVEVTYPHIEKPADAPARLRRLPRVRVAQIAMDYLAHGWSADEICRQHSYLLPAEVHSASAYYFDRRDASEIREEWAEAEKSAQAGTPPAFLLKLKDKKSE